MKVGAIESIHKRLGTSKLMLSPINHVSLSLDQWLDLIERILFEERSRSNDEIPSNGITQAIDVDDHPETSVNTTSNIQRAVPRVESNVRSSRRIFSLDIPSKI